MNRGARAAQVCPIDTSRQLFAPDAPGALAIDVDAQGFAELLTGADCFSQVADGRAAQASKLLLLIGSHRIEVCA